MHDDCLNLGWERPVGEGIREGEVKYGIEGHVVNVDLRVEAPLPSTALLLPPEVHETEGALVDVWRGHAVEERGQHEVLDQTAVGLPDVVRLEVDVVVGGLGRKQIHREVRAVEPFASEEDVLGLAVVGDEDHRRAAAEAKRQVDEELADGRRGVSLGLAEQPLAGRELIAADGGGEGGDVAQDG